SGQANPDFTANYSGFVNGENETALGGRLTFATLATTESPAGSYPVTPSGLTSGNYYIEFVVGTLTVTAKSDSSKAPQPPLPRTGEKAVGVVRAGKKGEEEPIALANNLVTMHWNEFADLSGVKNKTEMKELYRKAVPAEADNAFKLGAGVSQV